MTDPLGMTDATYFVVVLAADVDDYADWCHASDRTPFATSAVMISAFNGFELFQERRTFQVTDRWRESSRNRAFLDVLRVQEVPYGDEEGPWPAERVPDLSWPAAPRWRRLLRPFRTAVA